MPVINIRMTTGASQEQKDQLISGVTQLMVDVLNKNPENVHVIIEEIPPENWGVNGVNTVINRQRRAQNQSK